MAGTGLPIPKSGDARTQPIGVIDGDKLSSAQAWTQIAQAGAEIAKGGLDSIKIEEHQQQVGYYAAQDVADARKAADLRDKYRDDPDGFDREWKAYSEGSLSQAPAWAVPHRTRTLGTYGNSAYAGLLNEKRAKDQRLANDSWTALVDQTGNQVTASALAGTLGTPAGQAIVEKYRGVIQSGVASRFIAQEEGDRRIAMLTSQATVYATRGAVRGEYDVNGASKANAMIDQIVRDEKLLLSPEQRFGLANRLKADVHAWESERRASLDPVKLEAQAILDARTNGQVFSPERIEETVKRFKQHGGVAEAANFLAEMRRLDEAEYIKGLPVAQSAQILAARREATGLGPSFSPEVNGAIEAAAAAEGVDPALMKRIAKIESGGRPGAVTRSGTYKGLYQFSDAEFQRFGGGDIFNPVDNARAAARKTAAEIRDFTAQYGRAPTPTEIYLQHQQGVAGLAAHLSNPSAPAWENMASTGEGQQKGERWAKLAIWGNIPDSEKARFGSVENVTSADFMALWQRRVEGGPGTASPGEIKFQGQINKDVRDRLDKDIDTIAKEMEGGTLPTQERLNGLLDTARIVNDPAVYGRVSSLAADYQLRRATGANAPAQSAAEIAATRQQGATAGLSEEGADDLKIQQKAHDAKVKGLADDPLTWTINANNDRVAVPKALNVADSDAFRAGLQQRVAIAQLGAQQFQQGPMPALTKVDTEAVQAVLDNAAPRDQARIFRDITAAIPDEATRNATLAALGKKSPGAMVAAWAGALYSQDPNLAESILRGQRAMQTDPRFNAVKEDKTGFNEAFDKMLPAAAFSAAARTNPSGAWATLRAATLARYADLTAADPNAGKDFNEARLQRAVNDVTGGVVVHNGTPIVAPVRGMTQAQFDARMAGLTDADLPGVTTLNGTPITAEYFRRNARLESIGQDRYLVQIGLDPANPQYAVIGTDTGFPSPFVFSAMADRPERPSVYRPNPGGEMQRGFRAGQRSFLERQQGGQ